jgi:hypothetical protein
MTTLKNIPFRIPDQWDAQWYRVHVAEVLDPADVRGATLLDASGVATQISAHNADPLAHGDVINLHVASSNPHTQYLTDAPSDGQKYVRQDGAWVIA